MVHMTSVTNYKDTTEFTFQYFKKLFRDGLNLVPLLMSLCKLSGEMSTEISLPFFVETFVNNVNRGQNQAPAINRRASPQNTVLIPLPEKDTCSLPAESWNLSSKPFIILVSTKPVCDRYIKAASTRGAKCENR